MYDLSWPGLVTGSTFLADIKPVQLSLFIRVDRTEAKLIYENRMKPGFSCSSRRRHQPGAMTVRMRARSSVRRICSRSCCHWSCMHQERQAIWHRFLIVSQRQLTLKIDRRHQRSKASSHCLRLSKCRFHSNMVREVEGCTKDLQLGSATDLIPSPWCCAVVETPFDLCRVPFDTTRGSSL